jgi:hypothetical protein
MFEIFSVEGRGESEPCEMLETVAEAMTSLPDLTKAAMSSLSLNFSLLAKTRSRSEMVRRKKIRR